VFIVAVLGWLFDCLDQQLFNLARRPAMLDLLAKEGVAPDAGTVAAYSGYATSIFLIGWATGGLIFGVIGDKFGRAKAMMLTILLYSLFTGLSALSVSFWDFALYRFLTGLGVGGEFAVGVALVAEVMPDRARPYALGLLQALSAVGNISAALISMTLGFATENSIAGIDAGNAWRIMFVIGIFPALLVVVIRRRMKEPEKWANQTREQKARSGSYAELFGDPRWRKNTLIGLTLAFSGVVGLWGIGFFSIDLIQSVLKKKFTAEGLSPNEIAGKLGFWSGVTSMMLNVGAFLGMNAFSFVTGRIGRRPTFAIAFILAAASTAMVFAYLSDFTEIFWMLPLMGFCQLALFGGYAIYLPELFPTRLRSTGTSFCYNVGRFVAAIGPVILGVLTSQVYADWEEPMRPAGVTMCAIFLLGLLALPFAPETRGKPLPE
jgi:MFS family permease